MFYAALIVGIIAAGGILARGQRGPGAGSTTPHPSNPQLVLRDADIGDDIDDAFALALALRSPEIKLLGITTAFGDTDLRAELVDRYLNVAACGANIPVIPGVPTPHSNVFTQAAYASHKADFGCAVASGRAEAEYARHRKSHDAAGFLLNQIRSHPGKITLIAIGPLFNVQAAIALDPALFRQLKRVVLMGGSIKRGYDDAKTGAHRPPDAEWNIHCDPAGLRALLGVGVPVLMMPLDSTQIHLQLPELGKVLSHGSALTDQLTLLYHQWTGASEWRTPTLFDPMTVAFATRPGLCPVTPMRLTVDDQGFTRRVAGEPNVEVCLKSDEKGFLDLLMRGIVGQNSP